MWCAFLTSGLLRTCISKQTPLLHSMPTLSFPLAMVLTAERFRQRQALQKYGSNAADKLVRASAFHECDYTEAGQLREFATEAEVLAFEAAGYEVGTVSKVIFWNKPRATATPEQLALEDTIAHAVTEDGNQTRVQLAGVEEGMHARMGDMEKKSDMVLDYHEKAPPKSQEGDLELMARVQKMCEVGRMNAILKEFCDNRPTGRVRWVNRCCI